MADSERFEHAIAAIDAGNADDPNIVTVRARTGPKEILHAELVTYPNRKHGFDFSDTDPMTADAIDRVVRFFQAQLHVA